MLCYATKCCAMPQHAMLRHSTLCCATTCYATTRYALPQHTMLCHNTLCYATSYAMPKHAMLCHTLCYATRWRTDWQALNSRHQPGGHRSAGGIINPLLEPGRKTESCYITIHQVNDTNDTKKNSSYGSGGGLCMCVCAWCVFERAC